MIPAFQASVEGRTRRIVPVGGISGSSYTTNFPLTENPINEGSHWINGQANGIDWSNVKTASNRATGSRTMEAAGNRYSDDIAIINNSVQSFHANQYAQGTVYKASGYTGNGGSHEIELLLHFNVSSNNAHGYEVLWGIQGYIAIVRWEGPVNSYTALYDPGPGSIPVPADGDILTAQIVDNIISVKRNGVNVAGTTIDITSFGGSVWTTGQPGMGFWPVDGGQPDNLGWKTFTAGEL